jgi:hypothetical protein
MHVSWQCPSPRGARGGKRKDYSSSAANDDEIALKVLDGVALDDFSLYDPGRRHESESDSDWEDSSSAFSTSLHASSLQDGYGFCERPFGKSSKFTSNLSAKPDEIQEREESSENENILVSAQQLDSRTGRALTSSFLPHHVDTSHLTTYMARKRMKSLERARQECEVFA